MQTKIAVFSGEGYDASMATGDLITKLQHFMKNAPEGWEVTSQQTNLVVTPPHISTTGQQQSPARVYMSCTIVLSLPEETGQQSA